MRGATGAIGRVLVGLVGVGGCGAPVQTTVLPTEVVALPGLALQIEVSGEPEVVVLRSGRVSVTLWPRTRHPLWMELSRAADPPVPGLDLREGALVYRLETSDAGMGGEHLQLIGRIDVGGVFYDVRCAEESEDRMTLGWCFTALATLQAQR